MKNYGDENNNYVEVDSQEKKGGIMSLGGRIKRVLQTDITELIGKKPLDVREQEFIETLEEGLSEDPHNNCTQGSKYTFFESSNCDGIKREVVYFNGDGDECTDCTFQVVDENNIQDTIPVLKVVGKNNNNIESKQVKTAVSNTEVLVNGTLDNKSERERRRKEIEKKKSELKLAIANRKKEVSSNKEIPNNMFLSKVNTLPEEDRSEISKFIRKKTDKVEEFITNIYNYYEIMDSWEQQVFNQSIKNYIIIDFISNGMDRKKAEAFMNCLYGDQDTSNTMKGIAIGVLINTIQSKSFYEFVETLELCPNGEYLFLNGEGLRTVAVVFGCMHEFSEGRLYRAVSDSVRNYNSGLNNKKEEF